MVIQEVHYETGKRTKTWKFDTNVFNYNMFLSKAAHAVAEEGKTTILSGHFAEIAQVIDEYLSKYLFQEEINFEDSRNCIVLPEVIPISLNYKIVDCAPNKSVYHIVIIIIQIFLVNFKALSKSAFNFPMSCVSIIT